MQVFLKKYDQFVDTRCFNLLNIFETFQSDLKKVHPIF